MQPLGRASSDALHRVNSLPPCVTHLQGGPHPHHTASSSPLLFFLTLSSPCKQWRAAEKEPRRHELGPSRPNYPPPRPNHPPPCPIHAPRAVARRREVRPWRPEVLLSPLPAREPPARPRAATPQPRAATLPHPSHSRRRAAAMLRAPSLAAAMCGHGAVRFTSPRCRPLRRAVAERRGSVLDLLYLHGGPPVACSSQSEVADNHLRGHA
jgi:hypothetical protein